MAKPTTRKRGANGGDQPKKPAPGFSVYEIDYETRAPRGEALARFATRAEADAFVKGLNFHDPKTVYAIKP